MVGASRAMTSAEMGPFTMPQISSMIASKGLPDSLAMRLGLVVTPSRMPHSLMRLISAILAVSMKNFMGSPGWRARRAGSGASFGGRAGGAGLPAKPPIIAGTVGQLN